MAGLLRFCFAPVAGRLQINGLLAFPASAVSGGRLRTGA
jgi:hypothetical protein